MTTDFDKEIRGLVQKIDKLIQTHEYAFEDIFPKKFMLEYTNSTSIDNFLTNSPLEMDFTKILKTLSYPKLDQYVAENTPFSTWNAMYIKGVKTFLSSQLNL